ncbi:ATP-binding mismatch repair protein [Coemansia erecta]|uniref:ATP-binding mismatch repair protein n=1 Tax=Coemansia erecta TaxID=147472 RepID=A0A9W7Y5F9_9FUNG|nr:ATP-binding mismatch repair protein [Coemansia erecta]
MQAIDKDTVHRLCSGQVIVDLTMAVKELVENALDAGATTVDVKLKDSGLTSITVSDNGRGISADDRAHLCRKHWTSKIQSFSDLSSVSTFGFRGEALSSLCAMAKVTVTTATEATAPMGVHLEYDGAGELSSTRPVARERGTTVVLEDLFARWPVRQMDLRKNIRREYLRAVAMVEQYAVVCDEARITMSNRNKSNDPVVAVRTPAGADRLARLVSVLGAQMRPHMTELSATGDSASALDLGLAGYISKPVPEAGRSAADKQYFFVNGRPCDFPRAKKLVNEVFRGYVPGKYPVYAVSIEINRSTVDVNLTPDKRMLLLRHEDEVLGLLEQAVEMAVRPKESVFGVQMVQTQIGAGVKRESSSVPGVIMSSYEKLQDSTNKRLKPLADENLTSLKAAPVTPQPQQQKQHKQQQPASVESRQSTKKPQVVTLGTCRNRVQNDRYAWDSVESRLRLKQQRKERLHEESQRLILEAEEVDPSVLASGLSSNDTTATSALSRLIHKADFAQMTIVGQFNLGFIIARLKDDLYIIDQHASDEKHHFEDLQRRCVIASQPLIRPVQLQMGVVDESVAIECREELERSGFCVEVDEGAEVGERIRLVGQPVVDRVYYDKGDLMDLVGKLAEGQRGVRCERARRVFASRACRKAVMIGHPLDMASMRTIVRQLSDLDHPWNCPHGRPTMRHLYRLQMPE